MPARVTVCTAVSGYTYTDTEINSERDDLFQTNIKSNRRFAAANITGRMEINMPIFDMYCQSSDPRRPSCGGRRSGEVNIFRAGCCPCESAVTIGPTGDTGPIVPTKPAAGTAECFCVLQMRNILAQIIALYPDSKVIVAMESGDNVSGRPGSLLPDENSAGIFQLVSSQGTLQEAVSVCRIAAVRVAGEVYDDGIAYLPAPVTVPEGCSADCLNAVREYLPAGTEGVIIKSGGQTVAIGSVRASEYGILALTGPNGASPTFVSACKAEIITL